MNAKELETYRQKLFALGARLKGDVHDVTEEALRQTGGEAAGDLSNTPMHLADLGTDTFEQEVAVSLLANEREVLVQIADALDRIDAGTYGKCARCGQEIAADRLRALAYAAHCIECARKLERYRASESDRDY
jgi:RNA polymerase-binding transcription factor DksA